MSYVDTNLKKADKFYKLKEFDKANDFYNLVLNKFPKKHKSIKRYKFNKKFKKQFKQLL